MAIAFQDSLPGMTGRIDLGELDPADVGLAVRALRHLELDNSKRLLAGELTPEELIRRNTRIEVLASFLLLRAKLSSREAGIAPAKRHPNRHNYLEHVNPRGYRRLGSQS